MRFVAVILLAAPSFAQIAGRPTPAAAVAPSGGARAALTQGQPATPRIPLSTFVLLERNFDTKLGTIADGGVPIDLLGATRGIYLDSYGAVFTTEMGLVQTPTVNPFNRTITDAQKSTVHSAKLSRLPALKKVMTEALRQIATTLAQVPETQQVVLAVRLDYLNWENTSGLPGLVVAKADRRSAMAGNIAIEEQ